jgi:hypothetical protein
MDLSYPIAVVGQVAILTQTGHSDVTHCVFHHEQCWFDLNSKSSTTLYE